MRLTAELVGSAPVRINPLTDRELELRGASVGDVVGCRRRRDWEAPRLELRRRPRSLCAGLKIAVIENLGVTRDGFDCFDLSDNEIARLENFPVLR